MLIQKISTANKRRVISLIQDECCNYMGGDCVAMDLPCVQVKRMRETEEQEGVSPFVCRWFLDAVLPFDKDLHTELVSPQDLKRCEKCQRSFTSRSNSAKYCEICAAELHKKAKREYAQKKRSIL